MLRDIPLIGENVKKFRKKIGISQDKLSKLANVSHNTIVKIESGKIKNPTIKTAQKIAKALGISLGELLK